MNGLAYTVAASTFLLLQVCFKICANLKLAVYEEVCSYVVNNNKYVSNKYKHSGKNCNTYKLYLFVLLYPCTEFGCTELHCCACCNVFSRVINRIGLQPLAGYFIVAVFCFGFHLSFCRATLSNRLSPLEGKSKFLIYKCG